MRLWFALVMGLFINGCAAPAGDFGRPAPSYLNDTILPVVGREMARERGEPVSYFMLTEDEEELRARAYRLIMPIHRRAFFARSRTELVRARIWPDEAYRVDAALYYNRLRSDGFRSSAGRYNAMESEVLADLSLIDPFFQVVQRVCRADFERLRALGQTTQLSSDEEADAIGRVYENRRVVEWALTGFRWRLESYGFALERSRIEIPSDLAVAVELALGRLHAEVAALDAAVQGLDCRPAELLHAPAGASAQIVKR